jgi:hypothetical protein
MKHFFNFIFIKIVNKETNLNKLNKKIEMLQLIIRNQINISELNKVKNKELFKIINDINISNIDKAHEYRMKNKILLEKIFRIAEKIKDLNSK